MCADTVYEEEFHQLVRDAFQKSDGAAVDILPSDVVEIIVSYNQSYRKFIGDQFSTWLQVSRLAQSSGYKVLLNWFDLDIHYRQYPGTVISIHALNRVRWVANQKKLYRESRQVWKPVESHCSECATWETGGYPSYTMIKKLSVLVHHNRWRQGLRLLSPKLRESMASPRWFRGGHYWNGILVRATIMNQSISVSLETAPLLQLIYQHSHNFPLTAIAGIGPQTVDKLDPQNRGRVQTLGDFVRLGTNVRPRGMSKNLWAILVTLKPS